MAYESILVGDFKFKGYCMGELIDTSGNW